MNTTRWTAALLLAATGAGSAHSSPTPSGNAAVPPPVLTVAAAPADAAPAAPAAPAEGRPGPNAALPGPGEARPPSLPDVLLALRQLYERTGGNRWARRRGWPTTPAAWQQATLASVARWEGIKVANGRVVELNLMDNRLTGSLPPELGRLTDLEGLALGANQLTGPLPPELSQLAALTELSLHSNRLSGTLPSALGQMRQLKYLLLNNNQFTGPLPSELSQLTALEALGLIDNQFTGPLPPGLERFADQLPR